MGRDAGCCHTPALLPARAPAASLGTAGFHQRLHRAPDQQGLCWSPLGHNPGPPPSTPSVADTRFCHKVLSYRKVSSGLKSGGSCESGKVLETHHMLGKKGKKKEKEQWFTYAAILQAEEGNPRSCRHEVLKAKKNKWRRTRKHSQSRKTPAIQQLSYRTQEALFRATLLCQQHL